MTAALVACVGLAATQLAGAPDALAQETGGAATHLTLRLDPLSELYFSVRAQAARSGTAPADAPPLAGLEAAVEAARRIQATLGAFGGWGPLDSNVFTAGDPATLLRRFEAMPETVERRGREVAIRADAVAWARALEAAYPDFLARTWPPRRRSLESLVTELEKTFLPSHRRALDFMMRSLAIADPGIEVPVVLVTECHLPGASTYYLSDGSPASVVGTAALAASGQLAETILHEATHGLDLASRGRGSVFGTLRVLLEPRGVSPGDRLYHDVPHTLMFVQAAETMRRIYDPGHVPYGESSGVYARSGKVAEVERRIWLQVLDGTLDRDLALRRIVDELAPTPAVDPAATPAPRR